MINFVNKQIYPRIPLNIYEDMKMVQLILFPPEIQYGHWQIHWQNIVIMKVSQQKR